MARSGTTNTGTAPDAATCGRCGRKVALIPFGGKDLYARHKDPKTKRPCRSRRPPMPDVGPSSVR